MSRDYQTLIKWSSNRAQCPECGSSDGRADILTYGNDNVEGQGFYKCFSCGAVRTPRTFFNQDVTSKTEQKTKIAYENTIRKLSNNLLKLIGSKFDDLERILSDYPIGSDAQNNAIFWYSNNRGVYKCKAVPYGIDGKRLKKNDSPLPKNADALAGYAVNNEYFTYFKKDEYPEPCCFGYNSLKKNKQIIIVEAEKSAILGAIAFPQYSFISFGGVNGLSKNNEKLLAEFNDKPIAVLYDADTAGLEASKKLCENSKTVNYTNLTPAFCKLFDGGFDVADLVLSGDYDKKIIDNLLSSDETQEADNEKSTIGKMHNYFTSRYVMRRNTLTQLVEKKPLKGNEYEVIEEEDLNTIWVKLKLKGINVRKNEVASYLGSSFISSYDPFQNYLDSLPKFDPKKTNDRPIKRLASLVKVANDEQDLFEMYLKHWLCGFYKQALGVGTNPYLLIFYGDQQIGKSQFARRIMPKCLCDYTANSSLASINKDTKMEACRNYLIELDELDYISKASELQIKQFLTTDKFMVRAPYAIFEKKYNRHASFIGSSNVDSILQDPTGSRRFLIIEALTIDYEKITEKLMREVFAQVRHLVEVQEFDHYFDKAGTSDINESNEKYRNVSFLEIAISKHFTPVGDFHEGTTLNDIKYLILERENRIKEYELSKVGAVLKKLGYSNKQIKKNGKNERLYNLKINSKYGHFATQRNEFQEN